MNYGMPYQGSKSKIAEWVVANLPRAAVLVDIFAGGCAVAHAALLSGKWGRVVANDITDTAIMFKRCTEGAVRPYLTRWVSREEFFALKDTDPIIRMCWSFGNDQRTYLYSRELEPYKRAFHRAVAFGDYDPMKEQYGLDFSPIDGIRDMAERRVKCRKLVFEHYRKQGVLKKKGSHYYFASAGNNLRNIEQLESLERLQSLQSLERLQSLQSLTVTQGDYRDVEIPENAVIYADPPYIGTRDYRGMEFDHEAFYSWCERQTAPVVISEYSMPEDRFTPVASRTRISGFSATNNSLVREEKLYVPKSQHEQYLALIGKLL